MAKPQDDEKFPAPVYKETVLAPLFEGVKRHHWRHQMRINRASAVMLAERRLIAPGEAKAILDALDDIVATVDVPALVYTGEHEDFFFYVEAELIRQQRLLGVLVERAPERAIRRVHRHHEQSETHNFSPSPYSQADMPPALISTKMECILPFGSRLNSSCGPPLASR